MNSTLRGGTSFELGNDAGGALSQQGRFKRGHLLVVMPVILEQFKWGLGLGRSHFFAFAGYYFIENIHRSEEHTSELQSRPHLVCRLLLEKKKKKKKNK